MKADDLAQIEQRKTFLPTKVTSPRIDNCLYRENLFHRLDQATPKPLVWISGPAGCGKTILIASYLEKRGFPKLWYQTDSRDSDPATLFFYLSQTIRKDTKPNESLPLLTP
jgi:LuxR family maltose regulon positive regulatory protein